MRMNICELCSSISETYKDNAKKVVLINTSDVYDGKCTNHTFVDNKNLKGQFKKTFRPNDILYSEIRPANRRFAYIDFDTKDYIASTKLMVIRANKGVNPKYLYQILRNNTTINTLQMLAESRSGTFPQITFSELSNIEIDVPSEENQDLIVTILSSLDAKIETNNKLNEKLEEMAQAIFKSWFVDFEPFKDKPFHETELGMIPEGWNVCCLGDITKQTKEKVGSNRFLKVLSPINTGELTLSEDYFTKQVYSKDISKYILVRKNNFAYNPARVNIGSLGRNEYDFDGCVSPVYVVFEVIKEYENFFDLFRRQKTFINSVISLAIGGVRQSLSYNDFSYIKLVVPPKNVIEKFNDIYAELDKFIKTKKIENDRLASLRDTLLPRLMSGELKV